MRRLSLSFLLPCILSAQVELSNGRADAFVSPLQWEAFLSRQWEPIQVPGYWVAATSLPTGNLRYRLRFQLAQSTAWDALEATEIHAASVIFLNGTKVCQTGQPGTSRETERARIFPVLCALPTGLLQTENELLVEVSNFHTRSGGILSLKIGRLAELEREQRLAHLLQGLYTGVIGLAGFIFLIYYLSRKETSHLFFSIACLLIIVRIFSSKSYLELIFPEDDITDLRFILEYATAVSLLPAIFGWYFHFLLQPEKYLSGNLYVGHRICLYTITLSSAAILIFVLWTGEASVYGTYQPIMVRGLLLPAASYLLLLQIALVWRGNLDARLTLTGYLLLAMAVFHDGLITIRGEAGPFYVPAGMLSLIGSLCFVMGRNLRRITERLKESNEDLRRAHERLTAQDAARDRFLRSAALELQVGLGNLSITLQNLLSRLPQAQHKPLLMALDPLQSWLKDAELVASQSASSAVSRQENAYLLLERLTAELSPEGLELTWQTQATELPESLRFFLGQLIRSCHKEWLASRFVCTTPGDAIRMEADTGGDPPQLRSLQRILLDRILEEQGWSLVWFANGFEISLQETSPYQERHIAFLREFGKTAQARREARRLRLPG